MNERFQNNYDFLRVFAAVCIMYYHSFALVGVDEREPLFRLTEGRMNVSFIGLCIFFAISGYLIAKSAINSPTLINYLWKRLLRIQPLLIVLCILTVTCLGLAFTSLSAGEYFTTGATWTYFRNIFPAFGIQFSLPGVFSGMPDSGVNGSLWTLIIEERLYLFMCIIFFFGRKSAKSFIVIVILLNALYLGNRFLFKSQLVPYLAGYSFIFYLLFLNAAVLYLSKLNISKHPSLIFIAGVLLFGLATSFQVLNFLYVYAAPLMVNGVAYFRGWLNKAGQFGDFTYGLYVFAFPVQNALISRWQLTDPYLVFVLTLIIVLPMAVLSWHLLEKRCLRLKQLLR